MLLLYVNMLGAEPAGTRTSRSEISERMSMTSRAAWRLEVISALGIVVWWGLGEWCLLSWWRLLIFTRNLDQAVQASKLNTFPRN